MEHILSFLFLGFHKALTDVVVHVVLVQRLDNVLHVVCLSLNQSTQVEDHALGLVTLSKNGRVCVLKSRELLLVAHPLPLQLLSNFLLKDQSLQSIIALLLCTGEADSETGSIVLLLINKTSETTIFALVVLNLDLEILSLFRELLSKRLELEELLLPALELFDQEVVALRDLRYLCIHAAFEIDEVLPSLLSITRVLVALANNLVEVAHRNLGHQRLLDRTTKDRLYSAVTALLHH